MHSRQFIRRMRRYARRHGLAFEYDPRRGKGSHGRLWLGERLTTIKHGELGKGLVHKMLRDLGVNTKEF